MTTQLLIYETAIPVSASRHGQSSVQIGDDYAFARNVNSVPLMAVEFPVAAVEYAIVFAGTLETMMPAVILGLRGNENLFVGSAGKWQAKYVPAFLRRYPFVFSTSDDGRTFTLCIDESFPGFNAEGRGAQLFGADSKPTPYVENVLKFVQEYQAQFQRTQAFCRKVKELDLLEPMQAQISTGSGAKMSLGGFWAVNRARLKALSGDRLAELAQTDELELLYLHLNSMRNFNALRDRLAAADAARPGAASQSGAASTEPEASATAGNGANHAAIN